MPRRVDVFISTFSDTVSASCFFVSFDTDCLSVDRLHAHCHATLLRLIFKLKLSGDLPIHLGGTREDVVVKLVFFMDWWAVWACHTQQHNDTNWPVRDWVSFDTIKQKAHPKDRHMVRAASSFPPSLRCLIWFYRQKRWNCLCKKRVLCKPAVCRASHTKNRPGVRMLALDQYVFQIIWDLLIPFMFAACSAAIHLVRVIVSLLHSKKIARPRMLQCLSLDFPCTLVSFVRRNSEFSVGWHQDESRVCLWWASFINPRWSLCGQEYRWWCNATSLWRTHWCCKWCSLLAPTPPFGLAMREDFLRRSSSCFNLPSSRSGIPARRGDTQWWCSFHCRHVRTWRWTRAPPRGWQACPANRNSTRQWKTPLCRKWWSRVVSFPPSACPCRRHTRQVHVWEYRQARRTGVQWWRTCHRRFVHARRWTRAPNISSARVYRSFCYWTKTKSCKHANQALKRSLSLGLELEHDGQPRELLNVMFRTTMYMLSCRRRCATCACIAV